MPILAFDPGNNFGVAVANQGVITSSFGGLWCPKRVFNLITIFCSIKDTSSKVICEAQFMGFNPKSALSIARKAGYIEHLCGMYDMPFEQVFPSAWQKHLPPCGDNVKQASMMMATNLTTNKQIMTQDEDDAICMAFVASVT
jgi:Holliday junction resolvasome RuvABC endonuclease subunit